MTLLVGGREMVADNVPLTLQTVMGESHTLTLGRWRNWLAESPGGAVERERAEGGHWGAGETGW